MQNVVNRLRELGLKLPPVQGVTGPHAAAISVGPLVFLSGVLPLADGTLLKTGIVGRDVSQEEACDCARLCALQLLARVDAHVGGLNRVRSIPKVTVFVSSAPDFRNQSEVANAASRTLLEILGDAGAHCRTAVGVAVLPRGAPVEIEAVVEV